MAWKNIKIGIPMLSYLLLGILACLTLVSAYFLYDYTREILENRLKERLVAIVTTASLQFDIEDILEVDDVEDIGTEPFLRLTHALQEIRNANKDVHFAYLLRPTNDPTFFNFIADADSIDPYAKIDLNKDGIFDENDELAAPGDEYDASEVIALVDQAKNGPTTDPEPITADNWGTFISGYAPIKYKGETIAILTLDVEVSDFINLVTATFVPFLIFVLFLFGVLITLTTALVKIWGSRVKLLQDLDRQKDELLSIVSHQLATPITSMKWYVEMLLDGDMGKLTKEQEDQIKSMQSISADLSDLVGMILDVSRIQLGKIRIDKQKMDLNEFFKEILQVIEPKAKEKQQNFDVELPSNLPTAMLDKRYTRMTIENLLSNAVKYTPEKGSVQLKVELRGNMLSVRVKDTGVGIPKEDQAKIFGKLYRASNVRNSVDGNGFGLYVAKGAVEAQGGAITFKSEIGKGTTFFVELPIA